MERATRAALARPGLGSALTWLGPNVPHSATESDRRQRQAVASQAGYSQAARRYEARRCEARNPGDSILHLLLAPVELTRFAGAEGISPLTIRR